MPIAEDRRKIDFEMINTSRSSANRHNARAALSLTSSRALSDSAFHTSRPALALAAAASSSGARNRRGDGQGNGVVSTGAGLDTPLPCPFCGSEGAIAA
jgi:hypothetical protein